jgi:hypothetical protein
MGSFFSRVNLAPGLTSDVTHDGTPDISFEVSFMLGN